MCPHGFVGHIAFASPDTIINAQLTDRTEGLVVECWHAERGAQLFVELTQIQELLGPGRHLDAFIAQEKFLVAGIPQACELPVEHDARQNRHLKAAVGILPEFCARAVLFYANHPARAADGKAQRRQGVHGLLLKTFVDIPHSAPRVRFAGSSVKCRPGLGAGAARPGGFPQSAPPRKMTSAPGKLAMPTKRKPLTGDAPRASLTNEEILRYSRHLIMPEVGMEGQLKLKAAKVLLIGTGGLGAPLGLYLTAAGVGNIGLVDFDVVDFTNLQRQVIHSTADVGHKKLDSAAAKMQAINPYVKITKHEVALSSENALDILKDYDYVVDGTDNFPTRYLVNDACVLLKKPNIYGSIFRFEGQSTIFAYPGGPCYRCLYPEPPPPGLVPSCAEGGVLGILPGTIGLIQATEAVKLILGIGEPLVGRLLLYDALAMRFRELKLRKNPECPACGAHRTITKLIDYHQFCGIPHQEEKPVAEETNEWEIDAVGLKAKMDRGDNFVLID